eukprot:gene16590-5080_t
MIILAEGNVILQSLLLALGTSVDNFALGFSFGANSRQMPCHGNFFVAFTNSI